METFVTAILAGGLGFVLGVCTVVGLALALDREKKSREQTRELTATLEVDVDAVRDAMRRQGRQRGGLS